MDGQACASDQTLKAAKETLLPHSALRSEREKVAVALSVYDLG